MDNDGLVRIQFSFYIVLALFLVFLLVILGFLGLCRFVHTYDPNKLNFAFFLCNSNIKLLKDTNT